MRTYKALGLGRYVVLAVCLSLALAATTNAYSIIMHGGKRVEIPAQFNVTKTTITYEAAPGFWITLQMAAINIPATERANNEMPGSLLRRAGRTIETPRAVEMTRTQSKASRSVTNRELESFERSRLESERAYNQRMKEEGLPPLAVQRAQAAAEAERFSQELARQRTEADANERASQLQAQIAALSAQLNYLGPGNGGPSTVYTAPRAFYGGFQFFGGRRGVKSSLFRFPPGVQLGGAFGSVTLPFGAASRFHGFRRNIIIAPGTRHGVRRGFRGGPHGRPRSR